MSRRRHHRRCCCCRCSFVWRRYNKPRRQKQHVLQQSTAGAAHGEPTRKTSARIKPVRQFLYPKPYQGTAVYVPISVLGRVTPAGSLLTDPFRNVYLSSRRESPGTCCTSVCVANTIWRAALSAIRTTGLLWQTEYIEVRDSVTAELRVP